MFLIPEGSTQLLGSHSRSALLCNGISTMTSPHDVIDKSSRPVSLLVFWLQTLLPLIDDAGQPSLSEIWWKIGQKKSTVASYLILLFYSCETQVGSIKFLPFWRGSVVPWRTWSWAACPSRSSLPGTETAWPAPSLGPRPDASSCRRRYWRPQSGPARLTAQTETEIKEYSAIFGSFV